MTDAMSNPPAGPADDQLREAISRFAADRSMWVFRDQFPIRADRPAVSLSEGGTPLIRSRMFPAIELHWKDETRNPTGSHKDRALALASTHALQLGARVMAVASAGSTGLSCAAYSARAGLPSVILVTNDAPEFRVYPAFALGSQIIRVEAGLDEIIAALQETNGQDGIYVASTTRSSNPVQAEAVKTIAYEIFADLGRIPDYVVVPTGGGGTIAGIASGFRDLVRCGYGSRLPCLIAVVPADYDALRLALREGIVGEAEFAGLDYDESTPTLLSKLAHAHPPDGLEALAAIRETGGSVIAIDDETAVRSVRRIASEDGLYIEPASAIVAAALDQLIEAGTIAPNACTVALACGAGHRETTALASHAPLQDVTSDLAGCLDRIRSDHRRET